jgi:DNA-binding Lrp family transcriptional regulator
LTNYGQVLVCIARDPGIRLRDIGDWVGITERATHRIVVELASAGYITRERIGRRNQYTINADHPIPDAIAPDQKIGELLEILTGGSNDAVEPPSTRLVTPSTQLGLRAP